MDFKQTLDLITAGASIFGSLVIAFTALAAFRQLAHMRTANEINALTALYARWHSTETLASAAFVRTELPALLTDPTFIAELEAPELGERFAKTLPLINLLEEIGTMTTLGILREASVMTSFAFPIQQYWYLCEPVIRARRRLFGGICRRFEDLAARATDWLVVQERSADERLRRMPDNTQAEIQKAGA